MQLGGMPLTLCSYRARTTTNPHFASFDLAGLDRIYLPPVLSGLIDERPTGRYTFIEDDNRGAISVSPVATLDGMGFHLSVKGVGSSTDPYASRPLDGPSAALLTEDPDVRRRLEHPSERSVPGELDRIITGELWLRGSPYGGQGLEHASIALRVAERADLTSIEGFRIAPVVKIAHFPSELEERLRTLHWYRRFHGPIVQEIRLLPSNVRIYFHARNTLGSDPRHVFDLFGLDTNERALSFEVEFLRSTVPLQTLFARTLRRDPATGQYYGLDFLDVWLDKDAVLAPNGAAYFVDLEGIEEVGVARDGVKEKIEDQIFRSLYECVFAYEQLEQERHRRFGDPESRKAQFEALIARALANDRFVRLRSGPGGLTLVVKNALADEDLNTTFPLVDR